jgi:hypothetical protein
MDTTGEGTLKRNYYFLPVLAGVLLCVVSISYPRYQAQIQEAALTIGVVFGVLRVLWVDREQPRFRRALISNLLCHALLITGLRGWFPLRNFWLLGSLAVLEILLLVIIAYRIMDLDQQG